MAVLDATLLTAVAVGVATWQSAGRTEIADAPVVIGELTAPDVAPARAAADHL